MHHLYLRKVSHVTASENYRVILKLDVEEFEIGSIGIKAFTGLDTAWTWGIDTVLPMRAHQAEGRGSDRKDCMTKFRAAWNLHCQESGWLDEFLATKRRAKRT